LAGYSTVTASQTIAVISLAALRVAALAIHKEYVVVKGDVLIALLKNFALRLAEHSGKKA
jgi:hypothetical protein